MMRISLPLPARPSDGMNIIKVNEINNDDDADANEIDDDDADRIVEAIDDLGDAEDDPASVLLQPGT